MLWALFPHFDKSLREKSCCLHKQTSKLCTEKYFGSDRSNSGMDSRNLPSCTSRSTLQQVLRVLRMGAGDGVHATVTMRYLSRCGGTIPSQREKLFVSSTGGISMTTWMLAVGSDTKGISGIPAPGKICYLITHGIGQNGTDIIGQEKISATKLCHVDETMYYCKGALLLRYCWGC